MITYDVGGDPAVRERGAGPRLRTLEHDERGGRPRPERAQHRDARLEWQAKTPGRSWRPLEYVLAEVPELWDEWARVLENPSRLAAAREEPTGVRVDVNQRGPS